MSEKQKSAENALWHRFKEGDIAAFDTLIKAHYADLFSYGQKFSKDKDLLKDMVHDSFVALWQNRHNIDLAKNPKFYLITIFRNLVFKSLKTPYLFSDTPLEAVLEETAETDIIQKEEAEKVRFLIKKLPIRHQEALHLRFFEELDNEKIAELMQIKTQSVANLIHSGLKLLREFLAFMLLFLCFPK